MSIVSGTTGAVMASNAQDRATKAQSDASAASVASQERMYNQSREDFAPYRDPGSRAMATLESGIYGDGPRTYVDSNGVTQTAEYKPTESEGFKYTKARSLEDLGRSLRMMGRGSGTVAANATGRTLSDLYSNNEATYKNDILNFAKIGQGAAGSTVAASQGAANTLASLYQNQGNNAAQAQLNKANLWSGMGQQSSNAIGNAWQGYKIGQGLGWWGGSAGAGAGAGAGAAGSGASATEAYAALA